MRGVYGALPRATLRTQALEFGQAGVTREVAGRALLRPADDLGLELGDGERNDLRLRRPLNDHSDGLDGRGLRNIDEDDRVSRVPQQWQRLFE